MWSRLLLVPAIAGCAQLAGLDETSGDGREAITLSFERVSIGTTVIRAPADLSANSATYLVEDPVDPTVVERVSAALVDTDVWSGVDLFAPAPILFDLPDQQPRPLLQQWDFPNKDLLGSILFAEHPGAVPIAPESIFNVSGTLNPAQVAGETLQIFTVGSWNVRGLTTPAAAATTFTEPAFAMSTMSSLTGRPYEQITTDDAVFVLRYNGSQLIGVGNVAPFTQTGNDTLVGNVEPVATDKLLDLRIDPNAAATRFMAARPTLPGVSFQWVLSAAPGHAFASNSGVILHTAVPLQTDTMVNVMYANPFEGRDWRSTLNWSTTASRSVTPTGQTLAVTLSANMTQRLTDPAAGTILDFPAGLPDRITINGQVLVTDNQSFPTPTAPVEVTFLVDRPIASTYVLEVNEIFLNGAATALVVERRLVAQGLEPAFRLPPEVFQVGKTYMLRAVTFLGSYPNRDVGDFRTRELPVATAFLESGIFQVTQ